MQKILAANPTSQNTKQLSRKQSNLAVNNTQHENFVYELIMASTTRRAGNRQMATAERDHKTLSHFVFSATVPPRWPPIAA